MKKHTNDKNTYKTTTFTKQQHLQTNNNNTARKETYYTAQMMPSSSGSSKRVCVRAPTEIGADEWSHVRSFLYNDAFESACDLASMSKVCRSWREVGTWSQWGKAFGFFPLGEQFPTLLIPIMDCARKNGMKELEKRRSNVTYRSDIPWTINRFAAKEHLGLGVRSWRALKYHQYDDSRKAGDKHMYTVGDVLREAASRFVSVAALEKHTLRLALQTAKKEKKERLMGERHVQVANFLRSVGGECFAVDIDIRAYLGAYIWQGVGTFAEICQKVWEKRRAKDDEDAREIARVYGEIEAEQRVLADSRAKRSAKTRMKEERLLHVNAFLYRIGAYHMSFKHSCCDTLFAIQERSGTFEDLRTSLAGKHSEDKEIAAAEEAAYLDKGGARRIYVANFLKRIGGSFLIYEEDVQAYIMEGAGTFGDFTRAVLEKKHAKDEETFKESCAVYHRLMEGRPEVVFAEERVAHLDRGHRRRIAVAALLKTIGAQSLIHESGVKQCILNGDLRRFEDFKEQMVNMKRVKGEELEGKLLAMGPLHEF